MTATEGPPPPLFAVERNPRLRLIIPMVVAIAFFMDQLDSTIITTAIPDMARNLHTTPLRMNLAITVYILALAVFIPVSGWFADRFGSRRVFVTSLVVFTFGSTLCGIADSFGMLLVTRIIQGIGGAMMTPVGRLILLRSFPRDQFVTAITYMTIPALIGPVVGPLLGGFFTTYLNWRWIFYVNLPFGILGVITAWRFIEDVHAPAPVKFDFSGFILVGLGLALLQYGIEAIGHPTIPVYAIFAVMAGAVLSLVLFAAHARNVTVPVMDLSLFRQRTFRAGSLYGGLCRVGINAVPFLLPLMLQVGFGMSPIASGSLTFAASFGGLAVRPVLSRLLRRLGYRRLLLWGSLFGAACIAGFALVRPDTPRWIIIAYVVVFGLMRSTQFLASNTLSYSETASLQLSQATSLAGVLQQLSVSFGVSLSAMCLGLISHGQALTAARFHDVFLIMALIPLLSIPGFLSLRPTDGAIVSGYKPRP